MKSTKVKVQKVNAGLTFELVDKRMTAASLKGEKALRKAAETYSSEVEAVLDPEAATQFRQEFWSRREYNPRGFFQPLEPWGFVVGGVMNDTGSTPTSGRTRRLLAYQAPLQEVREGSMVRFERTYNV